MRLYKPEVEAQRFWNPYTQTMPRAELDQLARFLHLVVEHKHRIGFEGQLLIEPKPM